MRLNPTVRPFFLSCLFVVALGCRHSPKEGEFTNLFPENALPRGWTVRKWSDIKEPAPDGAAWTVENRILHGSDPRGTWLVSEKEYGDFILEFEFQLPERGNSGCGLRFPMAGDPAFDGLELQMVDPRYYSDQEVPSSELTGSLYRAVAPATQAFKPNEWNRYEIACQGPLVKVVLNEELILDVNLAEQNRAIKRHDGSKAPPLKERPRRGHIGFQELSRDGGHVQIRNVRIKEIK